MSKRKSGDTADTMLYSVVQKSKCPRYPERGKVWVANPVIKEVISFDKFINEAASRNSMPKSQLLQAVSLISDELRRQLRKGNRVKLNGIGDFYFSFKCFFFSIILCIIIIIFNWNTFCYSFYVSSSSKIFY